MKKDEIRALEEKIAKLEIPVVSNNSAHRWTPDVPVIIPEQNADHAAIIDAQKKRLEQSADSLPRSRTVRSRATSRLFRR
jgi:aspartate-semialdehyde dehydrogenase